MIVYGDPCRTVDPREALERVDARLRRVSVLEDQPARREEATRLLVETGELAQAVADERSERRGHDELEPLELLLSELALETARAFVALAGDPQAIRLDRAVALVAHLRDERLPAEVTVRTPEGYAFYGLYPEAYADAARMAQPECGSDVVVIGLRSIGTSLGAVVAAILGSGPPMTVRPVGHPFARTLALGPILSTTLEAAAARGARFAVVDEGPGLSGSSFAAVLDHLERLGIEGARIHSFPGHRGALGPRATERNRARWNAASRHVGRVDVAAVLGDGEPGTRVVDVSAGKWRELLYRDRAEWPAVVKHTERTKRLVVTRRGVRLAKFAGLGAYGDRALARAVWLASLGFAPRVVGLRDGYLFAEWLPDGRPLDAAPRAHRAAIAGCVSAYLRALARQPAADARSRGAHPRRLLQMAKHNVAEALGDDWARELDRWDTRVDAIASVVEPKPTDNKMQPWEWLALPDGRIVKTDGIDHHAGHDLVGCQDVAWDVAGAIVELDLDAVGRFELVERVRAEVPTVAYPGALAFFTTSYLAFHVGLVSLACDVARDDPEERPRLERLRARYAGALELELASHAR